MILFSQWRNLPISTRIEIAKQFGFSLKKGPTHVSGNEVVDDGFKVKDIEEALEVHHLQNYLDTAETDMGILWGWMVDKIEGREVNIPMKDLKPQLDPTPYVPTALVADKKNVKTKKK